MIPNTDITLYNRYIDSSRTEKYQRTVVSRVVWQSQKAIARAKEEVAANTALVMIPFERGAAYLEPKAWDASRANHWTLREGDLIVRGVVDDEISGGYTITSLRDEHEQVVMITSVDAMDQGSANVQHWEVNGK